MAKTHVGERVTSKTELLEGEVVNARSMSYRRSPLGGWIAGVLYLTNARLIFMPTWFSLGIGKRQFAPTDVLNVIVKDAGIAGFPNRWTMRILLETGTEQFGFGGFPSDRQRGVAQSWVEAIGQWANISD